MSRSALLSVIIPTAGQRPDGLRRVLDSIALQKSRFPLEVIVVVDTTRDPDEAPILDAVQTWHRNGPALMPLRVLAHPDPDSIVGHAQRQAGMAAASGRWLHCMADDDIYTPEALVSIAHAIRECEKPYLPLLFRVHTWQAGVVPKTRDIYHGNIDAECIVCPNIPEKLGVWRKDKYEGDYYFIDETVKNFGGCLWRPELISLCRPSAAEDWVSRACQMVGA